MSPVSADGRRRVSPNVSRMPVPRPSPRVVARRNTTLSRWFRVVEKDVVFPWIAGRHTYHAVATLPYVAVYALTPDLRVALVRQYRPAVEAFTWELPAGLIEDDTTAEQTCRRELTEETSLSATSVVEVGTFEIDTGRAEGAQHVFLAMCGEPEPKFLPEPGMEVAFVPEEDVIDWIRSGRVTSLPHIAAIFVARMHRGLS